MGDSMDPRKILTRHPANPLLTPERFSGVNTVFNPSPALLDDGRTVLLVSCTTFTGRANSFRETRVAWSEDGVSFILDDHPLVRQSELTTPCDALGGIIDCRLTRVGDVYYFLVPQGTHEIGFEGVCMVMYKTRDFLSAQLVDIVALPNNRGASLFPETMDGYYWRLDRPMAGGGSIWLSRSPDMVHWGHHRPLLAPGYSIWNGHKIGPTPPIRVPQGWLVILHGVDKPCDGTHYYIGAMLLDAGDPSRILGKTQSWLLAPEAPYEQQGQVCNVVFPCGAIAKPEIDELWLYYGAADTCVALATGSLRAVVQACLEKKK